jgi:hypothetical protein
MQRPLFLSDHHMRYGDTISGHEMSLREGHF